MLKKIKRKREKMSDFENKVCKVLGIVVFILVMITWLQVSSCTCVNSIEPPIEPEYIDEVDTKHLT